MLTPRIVPFDQNDSNTDLGFLIPGPLLWTKLPSMGRTVACSACIVCYQSYESLIQPLGGPGLDLRVRTE